MPRTVLGRGTRFATRGNIKILWIPESTMPSGTLTGTILNATTTIDLTDAVAAQTGFNGEQGNLPAPDMGSMKTGNVPGEITLPDASMTFYLSKDGEDVREVLHEGDRGYMVLADAGLATGALADVVLCQVKYGTKVREDVARLTLPFSVSEIDENVALPAAA